MKNEKCSSQLLCIVLEEALKYLAYMIVMGDKVWRENQDITQIHKNKVM